MTNRDEVARPECDRESMSDKIRILRNPLKPKYSGPLSKPFWDAVNALPISENHCVYGLGCALQDLEGRVLAALKNSQRKGRR